MTNHHCQAELLHFARTAFNSQSKELQMFSLLIAMRVEALNTLEPLALDEEEKAAMLGILEAWRRRDRKKEVAA